MVISLMLKGAVDVRFERFGSPGLHEWRPRAADALQQR